MNIEHKLHMDVMSKRKEKKRNMKREREKERNRMKQTNQESTMLPTLPFIHSFILFFH